jgi:hypothetical protein
MSPSMAKGNLEEATKWIVLVLLAFLALVFGGLFLIFFAPVVGYYIFRYSDKIKELEARLPKPDKPAKPDDKAKP